MEERQMQDLLRPLIDGARPAPGVEQVRRQARVRRRRRGLVRLFGIAVIATAVMAAVVLRTDPATPVRTAGPGPTGATRCPNQVVPSASTGADALPAAASATTDRVHVESVRRAEEPGLRTKYPGVRSTSVIAGGGFVWDRDATGEVVVKAADDWAIGVELRRGSDCPRTVEMGLGLSVDGVPAVFLAPATLDDGAGRIDGQFGDGAPWTVRDDPPHGLCVVMDRTNIGCDDVGPVVPPGADAATVRWGLTEEVVGVRLAASGGSGRGPHPHLWGATA